MKIKCLGGCREVGRNAILVEGKENILFDYGVKVETNEIPKPVERLDNIILGHAHLDHTGSIPILYRKFKVPIFSTAATFDQTHLLLKDSLKIARIRELIKHFGQSDIEKMKKNEARITYGQRVEAENFAMDVFDAGHIPGSIAPLIEVNGKRILYVSDFNTNPTRLLNGARIDAKNVDVLILESTYSNRNHPDRRETEKKFFEAIQGTIANGGVAVLPCFAVGRCMHPDTYVQTKNGEIIKISKLHNPSKLVSSDFIENKIGYSEISNKWVKTVNKPIRIKSRTTEIVVSPEHKIFLIKNCEIAEVMAKNLKVGDHLIVPTNIRTEGKTQKLKTNIKFEGWISVSKKEADKFKRLYKQGWPIEKIAKKLNRSMQTVWVYTTGKRKYKTSKPIIKNITLPNIMSKNLCQLLGYYLGDGSNDNDKIKFSDGKIENILMYNKLIKKLFGIKGKIRKDPRCNCFYLILDSRLLVRYLKENFPELENKEIPSLIQKCKLEDVASFIRGLYDAEGYVNEDSLYFGNTSKPLVEVLRLLLLRFGIVAFPEKTKTEYRLAVSKLRDIRRFNNFIGFDDKSKEAKLQKLISSRLYGFDDTLPVNKEFLQLYRILNIKCKEAKNILINNYKKCKPQRKTVNTILNLSKKRIFEIEHCDDDTYSILKALRISQTTLSKELSELTNMSQNTIKYHLKKQRQECLKLAEKILLKRRMEIIAEAKTIYKKIKKISKLDCFFDKIKKIETINKKDTFYDINALPFLNFVANGALVHNSAEILMILDSFKSDFPIYLDGMAKEATQIALDYPEFIKDPKALKKALDDVKPIYSNDERKKIVKEPCAIVTSSGMLEGGPSVMYIKYLYDNVESSIVFTGFILPRTAGRYLVDTGRFVTEGFDLKIKMGVHQFDFSVTPETPVLVRDFEKSKICPIKDVANNFDLNTLECYSFDKKNLKSGWHKVASIIKHNYSGRLFKITTKSGRFVEITQGHSIFVLRNGKIVDVPGEEVKVGDYIAIPKRISAEPTVKDVDFSKCFKYNNTLTAPKRTPVTSKLCRLLGYYTAEGHALDRVGISLNNNSEQEIATEITKDVNGIFSQLNVINYYPSPSELQLRFGGTLTARIFEELCGKGAYNKKAPEFLFQCSSEYILDFVGAYLTGDGWFEGGKIRAKSVSKKLIDDLIYLLLQAGIIAKYDGIRVAKERKAPQGTIFKESVSHVLRIQGLKDLDVIVPFLRGKIRNDAESYLKTTNKIWSVPPHGLPVRELDIKNSINGYNWRVEKILRSSTRNHINPNLIKDEEIKNRFLRDVINGDVAFDLVKEIVESDYNGEVYDFSVPGPQNFLGGFGGIFLHNSAHTGRDGLFDFVNKIKPEKVICIHGDNCERFATELRGRGFDAIAPKNGDIIDID